MSSAGKASGGTREVEEPSALRGAVEGSFHSALTWAAEAGKGPSNQGSEVLAQFFTLKHRSE